MKRQFHRSGIGGGRDAQSQRGWLIGCDQRRERQAIREAKNLISGITDECYPPTALLQNLEQEMQAARRQPLYVVETNVRCLVFVGTKEAHVDVVKVGQMAVRGGATRYCRRVLPVECAFRAEHFRMIDELETLFKLHSEGAGEIKSWMLQFRCRNNNKFKYKEVLEETERIAKKYGHFTDLYYPQWTVCIEICNHLMCISILDRYNQNNAFKIKNLGKIQQQYKLQQQQKQQQKQQCKLQQYKLQQQQKQCEPQYKPQQQKQCKPEYKQYKPQCKQQQVLKQSKQKKLNTLALDDDVDLL